MTMYCVKADRVRSVRRRTYPSGGESTGAYQQLAYRLKVRARGGAC